MEEDIKKVCHDCGMEMKFNGEELENGVYLAYENNGEKIHIFKCKECYAKNKSLTNYQPCEVYSRVVGYIRPVQQWNTGKQEEYKERAEFKATPASCDC